MSKTLRESKNYPVSEGELIENLQSEKETDSCQIKKLTFKNRGRSAQSLDIGLHSEAEPGAGGDGRFLQIRPALTDPRAALSQRSHTVINNDYAPKEDSKNETIQLQAVGEGKVQLARTPQEKDRLPDRISLDRRGLSSIPHIVGEPGLRLLSLQHNLINSLSGLSPLDLGKLVFLDVYDNQIDKIMALERLFSLRVLLLGKNRIKRIEGLNTLIKLEVLDLHGNRINKVGGLSNLSELKVLNLAGNQIKCVAQGDLQGLVSLRELNLKRNRLRKLLGFHNTPKLQKLYLANNDLQSVEDVSSLSDATALIEVSLDGNPVALGGDCTPFLVSYLPNLQTLTNMNVTEQVRKAAMAWRENKEAAHAAYCALGGNEQNAARRDQIINNARTNWELLRTENRSFNSASTTSTPVRSVDIDKDLASETTEFIQNIPSEVSNLPDVVISHGEVEDLDFRGHNSDTNINVSDSAPKKSPRQKLQRSATVFKAHDKRVNFSERSVSQDTDVSTSTSSDLRLPPILFPIISSLENVRIGDGGEPVLKKWESISSVEPVADSSFSSLPSSSSDSEEEAKNKRQFRRAPTAFRRREHFASMRSKSVCDPESRKVKSTSKNVDNTENHSNLSCNTNVGSVATSSTSGSDQNSKILKRDGIVSNRISNRNIRSATISRRSERATSANSRASTARISKPGKSLSSLKSSEPFHKQMPASKDREQGVDYLVEVSDGVVSVWGAGAVRRLSRDWEWERARTVTKAAFHYVHFQAVALSLPELKNKFPNVSHISFRATGLQWLGQLHALAELRGIMALTILPEGNPLCNKIWREYAVYRLAHWGLKIINDEPITDEEIASANCTYNGLSDIVLRAIPDAPLQPLLSRLGRSSNSTVSAKAWLRAADPALKDVIAKEALQYKKGHVSQEDMSWRVRGRGQLSQIIHVACGAALRLRTLDVQWPHILIEMIEEILTDFSNMESHVKEQMRILMDSF